MECEDDMLQTCAICEDECRIVTKVNVKQTGKLSNSSMHSYFVCIVCILSRSNQRYSVKRFLTLPQLLQPDISKGNHVYIVTNMKGHKDETMFGMAIIKTSINEGQEEFWPFPVDLTVEGQTVFTFNKNKRGTFAVFNASYVSKAGTCSKVQLRFKTENWTQPCYIASFVVKKANHALRLAKQVEGSDFHFQQPYNQLLKIHPTGIYFGRYCPCSGKIIKFPVRFKQCKHLQSFQASFIDKMLQCMDTISRCPICGIAGSYDDLILDDIQQAFLQKAFEMLVWESEYVKRINSVIWVQAKNDQINLTVPSDPKLRQLVTEFPAC